MYKIALINMPFAGRNLPSFALTQLKSVIDTQYTDRVSVEICYLNQDFAVDLGTDFYEFMTDSMEAYNAGLGEWLFRQVAFPELEENSREYLQRYFPYRDEKSQAMKRTILDKWNRIDGLLDTLIDKYKLDQADLVGFTTMFSQNVASFAMAREAISLRTGSKPDRTTTPGVSSIITSLVYHRSSPARIVAPSPLTRDAAIVAVCIVVTRNAVITRDRY